MLLGSSHKAMSNHLRLQLVANCVEVCLYCKTQPGEPTVTAVRVGCGRFSQCIYMYTFWGRLEDVARTREANDKSTWERDKRNFNRQIPWSAYICTTYIVKTLRNVYVQRLPSARLAACCNTNSTDAGNETLRQQVRRLERRDKTRPACFSHLVHEILGLNVGKYAKEISKFKKYQPFLYFFLYVWGIGKGGVIVRL